MVVPWVHTTATSGPAACRQLVRGTRSKRPRVTIKPAMALKGILYSMVLLTVTDAAIF